MSELIRFDQGVFSEAEISPERQLNYALVDNRQMKDTLAAIVEASEGVSGAELIKVMALFALARSGQP